jgi:hypothetical protein
MSDEINPLDRPLDIKALHAELVKRGESCTRWWLYQQIKGGVLPHTRHGKIRSTLRAFYSAMAPAVPGAEGQG